MRRLGLRYPTVTLCHRQHQDYGPRTRTMTTNDDGLPLTVFPPSYPGRVVADEAADSLIPRNVPLEACGDGGRFTAMGCVGRRSRSNRRIASMLAHVCVTAETRRSLQCRPARERPVRAPQTVPTAPEPRAAFHHPSSCPPMLKLCLLAESHALAFIMAHTNVWKPGCHAPVTPSPHFPISWVTASRGPSGHVSTGFSLLS